MVFKERSSFSGFTIVELLVVIVVIGILATITIVSYTGISQRATTASLTSDLDNASKQLKLFQVDNSNYPTTINCAIPDSSTNKCIKASMGNVYIYQYNNATPQNFCLAARNGVNLYNITNDSTPVIGALCLNLGIVTSGLILDLDAGSSASYPGSGNTWYDLSGNGYNSTLVNGVGYNSGTLVFDGASNYVITPNINNFRSILMLVNKDATDISWHYLFDARPGDGSGFMANNGIGTWANFYINGSAATNSWSSLPTGSWFYLYIEANANYSSTINFMSRFSNNEFSSGKISSIIIYNKVLSPGEITQNFNALRARYGL